MASQRIAFSSLLLIAVLAGCGREEVPVTPGRSMGAPPPSAAGEKARTQRSDAAPEAAASESRAERGNQAPELLGILIEPFGEVTVRHDIVARPQAKDINGDAIEFEYTWRVNGASTLADGDTLPKRSYRRGDWIELSVVASDGAASSEPLVSKPFEVTNAAPAIVSTPGGLDERGALAYQVEVEDPDDAKGFEYRLLAGPEGMRIDAESGLLTWLPSKQQTGSHSARIEVVDSRGGKVWQSFELALDLVSGVTPAAPAPN